MPQSLTVALYLLSVSASHDPATREAERLAKQSIVEYNVGDFEAALADATRAYKLKPLPGLLFDLAQCHRGLHHWEKAEFFYRGYLREKPNASNREIVEELIAEMEQKQKGDVPLSSPTTAVPLIAASPAPGPPPLVLAKPEGGLANSPEAAVAAHEETQGTSRVLPYSLAGASVAGLILTGVSAGELASYQSYRNGLTAANAGSYSNFSSRTNTAEAFNALLYVGIVVALGGATGAVLTW